MIPFFIDEYDRKARLYPALVILIPSFISIYAWFPDLFESVKVIVGVIVALGIISLLIGLTRTVGRHKEKKLIKKWGALPSTLLLRHSNSELEPSTKIRYHVYLQSRISNIELPTAEQEREDILRADLIYDSACRWLREHTRNKKKYRLIFMENVNYGFNRNLWALKDIGLSLTLVVLFLQCYGIYTEYSMQINTVPILILTSVVISLIFILIWTLKINEKFVRSSADAYARTLLATCEE